MEEVDAREGFGEGDGKVLEGKNWIGCTWSAIKRHPGLGLYFSSFFCYEDSIWQS